MGLNRGNDAPLQFKKDLNVKNLKLLAACTMVTLLATALTAKAADVRVTGTILPVACTPTISGGGVMNYGNINANALSPTDYTVLDEMTAGFSIICDAPTKVALRAVNGRPGSAAGSTGDGGGQGDGRAPVDIFGMAHVGVVGLGLDNQTKVGGYGIRITPGKTQADARAVDSLHTQRITNVWLKNDYSGDLYDPYATRINSWGATGSTLPIPFTTLTGELSVQAYLNKRSELDLSKPIALNGLTTIDMVYL